MRVTRAGARAAAAELRGRLFHDLPEEILVHVIRQLRGHLLLAAAVSHRLHGIVMQLMLPFRSGSTLTRGRSWLGSSQRSTGVR